MLTTRITRRLNARQVVTLMVATVALVFAVVVLNRYWWSNVIAERRAATVREVTYRQWSTKATTTSDAVAIGFLYVPRLSEHAWAVPILDGVGESQLNSGVGRFSQSDLPGGVGNFAVSGHRSSHGQPFHDFETLKTGDEVIVETMDSYFVYRLAIDKLVELDAVWVVNRNPLPELAGKSASVITLVAPASGWSSDKRHVWWGVLTSEHPKSEPPPAISAMG